MTTVNGSLFIDKTDTIAYGCNYIRIGYLALQFSPGMSPKQKLVAAEALLIAASELRESLTPKCKYDPCMDKVEFGEGACDWGNCSHQDSHDHFEAMQAKARAEARGGAA